MASVLCSPLLHPLAEFCLDDRPLPPTDRAAVSYFYGGTCPITRRSLQLPRTREVEAIARGLMAQLRGDPRFAQEGKMLGVLLVATASGERGVLKGFSGLLAGQANWEGWVPPIPGRAQVAIAEARTLRTLDHLKTELITLQTLPIRAEYAQRVADFAQRWADLTRQHRDRKAARDRQRLEVIPHLPPTEQAKALADLVRQSQQDGRERRRLKAERTDVLAPLEAAIAQADRRIQAIKRQRKALSQDLQRQMHQVYCLTNFAGITTSLATLLPGNLPTGTGDCAAPKLLHAAATHGWKPLALAEFWWGPPQGNRQPGQFYEACAERCQPIMGFLLAGLGAGAIVPELLAVDLPILYEDDSLLVVDKPTGLLSVPGRRQALQDSVLSRLRAERGEETYLATVHRLDKGTSGVLILAKSPEIHRALNQQFAQRQVRKVYEALLSRPVATPSGSIDLPLWRDPRDRPKQSVHFTLGKPSHTTFQVLTAGPTPRLRFWPHTGRTHQLRVHAAHPQGLNAPILGDVLYGDRTTPQGRLHLHAQETTLIHPLTQNRLVFSSPVPF